MALNEVIAWEWHIGVMQRQSAIPQSDSYIMSLPSLAHKHIDDCDTDKWKTLKDGKRKILVI